MRRAALAAAAALLLAAGSPSPEFRASQARVIDGDTFEAASGEVVRLWGIDAPEIDEHGGARAKRLLGALIASNTPLTCQGVDRDRWGRTVARCITPKGADVACTLIILGAAEEWLAYSGGAYQGCRPSDTAL